MLGFPYTQLPHQDVVVYTNIPTAIKVQFHEPPLNIGSNMIDSSKSQFLYEYTNPQDYFMFSANSSRRPKKYPLTNPFKSAMKLVATHTKNKP